MAKRTKIHFYRVDAGADPAGRPVAYDPAGALERINALPFTEAGRYQRVGTDAICCWPDRLQPPQRLRLGIIRRSDFPQIEEQGRLRAMRLRQTAGLAEQAQLVFLSGNIVGMAFNFYGPRIGRLRDYIKAKVAGTPDGLSFHPLLRHDVLGQLRKFNEIRVLDLAIHPAFAETIRNVDASLGEAFAAAGRAGNVERVQIVLKPRPRRRLNLGLEVTRVARRLAGLPELHEEADRFRIKGVNEETGRIEVVDILHDKLISTQVVEEVAQQTRALDNESAYRAIERGFEELEDELITAAALR